MYQLPRKHRVERVRILDQWCNRTHDAVHAAQSLTVVLINLPRHTPCSPNVPWRVAGSRPEPFYLYKVFSDTSVNHLLHLVNQSLYERKVCAKMIHPDRRAAA